MVESDLTTAIQDGHRMRGNKSIDKQHRFLKASDRSWDGILFFGFKFWKAYK
jgi:hypothetical protein